MECSGCGEEGWINAKIPRPHTLVGLVIGWNVSNKLKGQRALNHKGEKIKKKSYVSLLSLSPDFPSHLPDHGKEPRHYRYVVVPAWDHDYTHVSLFRSFLRET